MPTIMGSLKTEVKSEVLCTSLESNCCCTDEDSSQRHRHRMNNHHYQNHHEHNDLVSMFIEACEEELKAHDHQNLQSLTNCDRDDQERTAHGVDEGRGGSITAGKRRLSGDENNCGKRGALKTGLLIDTSSAETLERDFYAWLKGELIRPSSSPPQPTNNEDSQELSLSSPKSKKSLTSWPELASNNNDTIVFDYGNSYAKGSTTMLALPQFGEGCPNNRLTFLSLSSLTVAGEQSPPSASSSSTAGFSNFSSSASSSSAVPSLSSSPSSSLCGSSGGMPMVGNVAVEGARNELYGASTGVEERVKNESITGPGGMFSKLDGAEQQQQPLPSTSAFCVTSASAIRSSGTNQLGRTYSPGLPLSMDERQQIVNLYEQGWKICDISKKLCVTHSCVSKILNRFRTTGSVRPKDAKEGRKESPLVAAIRDYRLRLGIVRQFEIREQLIRDGICQRDNVPSRSSINHILRTKLNIKPTTNRINGGGAGGKAKKLPVTIQHQQSIIAEQQHT